MRLSRFVRPLASAMMVLAIALATLLTNTQSARATSPLTVSIFCEGIGGGSPSAYFVCDAFASGGTGSYTYSWSGSSTASISFADGSFARGRCRAGTFSNVTVTVTDSASSTASATGTFRCYAIAP